MGPYHIWTGGESIRRKSRELKPRSLIFVVCEGKSEENYFRHYKSISRELSINIWKFDRDSQNMIKKFKNKIKYDGIVMGENDKAWFVFDMDVNDNRVEEARAILSKNNYNLALSIPSFELWILLHYRLWEVENSSKQDVEDELKKYIKEYSHGMDAYPIIYKHTQKAIERAKKLFENKKKELTDDELYTSKANPITHVYKLVEFLEKNINK